MCQQPVNPIIWRYHPRQRVPIGFNAETVHESDHHKLLDEKVDSQGRYHALWKPTTPRAWWIIDWVRRNQKGTLDYVREFKCKDADHIQRTFAEIR